MDKVRAMQPGTREEHPVSRNLNRSSRFLLGAPGMPPVIQAERYKTP